MKFIRPFPPVDGKWSPGVDFYGIELGLSRIPGDVDIENVVWTLYDGTPVFPELPDTGYSELLASCARYRDSEGKELHLPPAVVIRDSLLGSYAFGDFNRWKTGDIIDDPGLFGCFFSYDNMTENHIYPRFDCPFDFGQEFKSTARWTHLARPELRGIGGSVLDIDRIIYRSLGAHSYGNNISVDFSEWGPIKIDGDRRESLLKVSDYSFSYFLDDYNYSIYSTLSITLGSNIEISGLALGFDPYSSPICWGQSDIASRIIKLEGIDKVQFRYNGGFDGEVSDWLGYNCFKGLGVTELKGTENLHYFKDYTFRPGGFHYDSPFMSCFENCYLLLHLNLTTFRPYGSLDNMFCNCQSLGAQYGSPGDSGSSYYYYFDPGEGGMNGIEGIEDWDMRYVTSICQIFKGCISMLSLDLHKWKIGHLRDNYAFQGMIDKCISLRYLNVAGWNPYSPDQFGTGSDGALSIDLSPIKGINRGGTLVHLDATNFRFQSTDETTLINWARLYGNNLTWLSLRGTRYMVDPQSLLLPLPEESVWNKLEYLSLPTQATTLFNFAYGCQNLTKVDNFTQSLANVVSNVDYCFYNCRSLNGLLDQLPSYFPVLSTANSWFCRCESLSGTLRFPDAPLLRSMTSAFYGTAIDAAIFSSPLTNCDMTYAFAYTLNLKKVVMPQIIGTARLDYCFANSGVTELYFTGPLEIDQNSMKDTFYGCNSLVTLVLPPGFFTNPNVPYDFRGVTNWSFNSLRQSIVYNHPDDGNTYTIYIARSKYSVFDSVDIADLEAHGVHMVAV